MLIDIFTMAQYCQRSFKVGGGRRIIERRCTRLLAEFDAICTIDQWQVAVTGRRKTQKLLQEYLARRGINQVAASNDVADCGATIIDGTGELIGVKIVFSAHDKIGTVFAECISLLPQ